MFYILYDALHNSAQTETMYLIHIKIESMYLPFHTKWIVLSITKYILKIFPLNQLKRIVLINVNEFRLSGWTVPFWENNSWLNETKI